MKVKSLRRHVKGRGTMRAQKMSISVTSRRKTWIDQHEGHIAWLREGAYQTVVERHGGYVVLLSCLWERG
jgi:hypothetical protein